MEKKIAISEYEELLKARRFYIEGQRQFHDFTFEKIKKGLGSEYLENINEKIERWIDITVVENFRKARPVEYYILVKMLYRDGFYESAIVTVRTICEMICYDILSNMSHPFGNENEISLINFRVLLKFIAIPKRLPKRLFESKFLNNISSNQDISFINTCFAFDANTKEYFLNHEIAKTPKKINKIFSIFPETGFDSYDRMTKENYDILNAIYDLGNTYIHASAKPDDPKKDARKVILDIGKVLFDIYGITSIDELKGYLIETAYKDYPDICSGINFMLEAFVTPEDSIKGYHNIPSEQFINKLKNIVGKWAGKWSCHGKIIEDARIKFELKNGHLKSTIENTFKYNNQLINLSEDLNIKFFQGYFQMQGFKHRLRPKISDLKYSHDFFELEFLGDDILVGIHKCDAGTGKALFFRT